MKQDGSDEAILLATFTHDDGQPISVCARDWKWYHVREGTRVKRIKDGD